MGKFNILFDLYIRASPEKIYKHFTQPEHLNNWWTKSSSGEPILGEEYNLFFTPEYNWFGKVSKAEKNSCFEIEMTQSSPDWIGTSFGIELDKKEDRTLVSFYHKNWREASQHFRHSSFSWALLLNSFKDYIENEIIVPFENRA